MSSYVFPRFYDSFIISWSSFEGKLFQRIAIDRVQYGWVRLGQVLTSGWQDTMIDI
jgi:hypothetical protein